jgi:hypothetical protein
LCDQNKEDRLANALHVEVGWGFVGKRWAISLDANCGWTRGW